MTRLNVILISIFAAWMIHFQPSSSKNETNYVQEACNVTRYQDICIQTLSPFSKVAKQNSSIWARAGVSVTLSEAKNVTKYLIKLRNSTSTGGRNRNALNDCVELFQDALDSLHMSLEVLRNLSAKPFDVQMDDLSTWMSTVLTDEDTCLDGFDESRRGRIAKLVRIRVIYVTYITSNALALINNLVTTGL